ncbi:hypothetical protein C8R44DRAFT_326460 [Mycena epipterygia]|nr:hypothetical protein C8R44DRAFT_326460 [Mycena epipterygia]
MRGRGSGAVRALDIVGLCLDGIDAVRAREERRHPGLLSNSSLVQDLLREAA